MAITDIYNSLTFGGVNSLDYGIFISGPGVYNAPARAVEMVSVPGRNGDISLDLGHYDNITVEYPAGTFGMTEDDFAEKISEFRNAIVSQIGYQRLEDTYHPDEFRLGIYSAGLSVSPVKYNEAGEFTLSFNCKPQRFLNSGETELSVASGGVITNPTLMKAKPIISLQGYGDVLIGDSKITKTDSKIGRIKVGDALSGQGAQVGVGSEGSFVLERSLDVSQLNNNNKVYLPTGTISFTVNGSKGQPVEYFDWAPDAYAEYWTDQSLTEEFTHSWAGAWSYVEGPYTGYTGGVHISLKTKFFDGVNAKVQYTVTVEFTSCSDSNAVCVGSLSIGDFYADSTKDSLSNPVVIDCETGLSYMETAEGKVSTNNFLILPADLTEISPGETAISYDPTITNFKIVPRWWKL